MAGIKVRKVFITKRSESQAVEIKRFIARSKKIVGAANRIKEGQLFNTYMTERQSMKKAHALNAWKKFIISNTTK